MRSRSLAFAVAAGVYAAVCLVVGLTASAVDTQQGRTTRDGVFTAAQAARGKQLFTSVCAKCHAFDLAATKAAGLEGPALGGDSFFNAWDDKSVMQLATSIRLGMPPDGSMTVKAAQAADVIAYILEANKLPAGESELPATVEARNIKLLRPASSGGR